MQPTRRLLVILTGFALASTVPAQGIARLKFTELLLDPFGANAGRQVVEVRSTGNLPVDLTGWHLVTSTGVFALPSVTIAHDGIARLHVGAAGTSTAADVYLPALAQLANSDALALFRSAAVTSPQDLVDFVAWGGNQSSITIAVQAGQWPSTLASAAVPAVEGHSLAHFDRFAYGSGETPEDWFVDGTPTLGLANDGGGIFAGAFGCPGLVYPPTLGSGEADNRPWIGERWTLDAYYLAPVPSTLLIGMGLTRSQTLPLDAFGIPGCFWAIDLAAVVAAPMPPDQGRWATNIPNNPNLTGLELLLQAAAPMPGANPANLLVTRVTHAFLGSR